MNFGEKIFYVTLADFAGRHGSNLTQSVVRGIFLLLRYAIQLLAIIRLTNILY